MHHHVLESVPVTSDNVSGLKLYLTVLRGLNGEYKATGEHITVRRNLFAENDFEVPRASSPAISARLAAVISRDWDRGSFSLMISVR